MDKTPTTIGRAEFVNLPDVGLEKVPARIDTGARTSAIWASDIHEHDGKLAFKLFGPDSDLYSGETLSTADYSRRLVASSTGHVEERYTVKLRVTLGGRKIRATFTLANRATQVYPMLVGRNILRGKFIVDVKLGKPLIKQEQLREEQKKAWLTEQTGKDAL